MGNYPRIEARYHDIDLPTTSLRKVLNLTYGWLLELLGGTETWEKDYAPIFEEHEHPDFDYVDLPTNTSASGLVLGGI